MSKQQIDYKFVSCATCRYWSGNVSYRWPGIVEIDTNNNDNMNSQCSNTYFGNNTYAWASCQNWEPRFKI